MSSDCEMHKIFIENYPHIARCMGASSRSEEHLSIVDKAIEYKCQKVQFFKPHFEYFNQDMIKKAHEHGIKCNLFYSDDVEETVKYLQMGIDTVLTNDYLKISNAVKKWKGKKL